MGSSEALGAAYGGTEIALAGPVFAGPDQRRRFGAVVTGLRRGSFTTTTEGDLRRLRFGAGFGRTPKKPLRVAAAAICRKNASIRSYFCPIGQC